MQKLAFKWLDLYEISDTIRDKGIHILEKLNKLLLVSIFAGNKLKKF